MIALKKILLLALPLLLASCASKKDVPYFQNSKEVDLSKSQYLYDARIMPKD
jgi:polysaccharide export outer membrane protein